MAGENVAQRMVLECGALCVFLEARWKHRETRQLDASLHNSIVDFPFDSKQ